MISGGLSLLIIFLLIVGALEFYALARSKQRDEELKFYPLFTRK